MKLHAFDAEGLMAHAHNFPLIRFRRHLKAGRKSRPFDDQRMIASGLEWIRQLAKDRATVVFDHGGFPVHQAFGPDDVPSEGNRE